MANIDLFNGDADGICALTQLRNAEPLESTLVTGVKRDIQLMDKIEAKAGDKITVLDISLDKNREGLHQALEAGAEVFYVDHHFAGDIPESDKLTAIINPAADVCTSILVNHHLNGQFVEWAITGAFGDNLKNSANVLAKPLNLSEQQLSSLENLGIYINYNGYGSNLDDLHFTPEELYRKVSVHASPFDFINDSRESFEKLENGYNSDMASAASLKPEFANDAVAAYILPNEAWARRVSGVYSNDLANGTPSRAHAVLTVKANGNYLISVRAPLDNKTGADELCRSFATGGGRAAAAGVNDLPADELQTFIDRFNQFYAD
ncbi:DHH family phosphoesterase [Oceanicoccus sagamiensis]|uniref:Acetyltransferase n=1 Tax=Oceanicoccus sagamiensis TaxID=716816 RepID=A0A1X9NFX2_9GAMM|nr:DHH family phosphoesterase [Oceanicoccus sagamiensis]ARN72903.1 acetyltransferase [Oceanicoccus sagamiensis]